LSADSRSEASIWMRPGRNTPGRPARRSRAEITAAAISLADRDGLEGVSMRRVAAELGTGAASLYRYLDTREDLLDLMSDAVGAEYNLRPPTGEWLADLIDVGRQAREIMRRHRWLAELVPRRPTLGPRGVELLQYVLEVLEPHPASTAAKVEAFGMLMAVTAVFVQAEPSASPPSQRNAGYLQHALSSGEYPRLNELLAVPPAEPGEPDRFPEIIGRVMAGLLAAKPDEAPRSRR